MTGEQKTKERPSVLKDKDKFQHTEADKKLSHMGDETSAKKPATAKKAQSKK